ncbi:Outer membrane protein assembly factor BamB [subsurface metagenome]
MTFHLDYGKSWAKSIYTRTTREGPFYATSITGDGSKMFRSNDDHGTVCFNAETGEEVWRRKDARGSEIYFNDNKVFVFYFPNVRNTEEELFCLNADTGEVLWSERGYSVGGLLESEEGKLYRIFVEKGTYKYDSLLSIVHFDTATGKALSQTKMIIKRFSSERYGFYYHIYNNKLYVNSRYIGGDRIKCFDINNGSLIWESNCKSNTWVFFGNKIYVSYYDSIRKYSYIYCLDADTGEEIWDKKIKEDTFSLTADNDFVVISTGAWWPKVYSFSASTGKIIWESQDYIGLLWPVINNGKIYCLVDPGGGGDSAAVFACLDLQTGARLWNIYLGYNSVARHMDWIQGDISYYLFSYYLGETPSGSQNLYALMGDVLYCFDLSMLEKN